jgi:O-Antigen ligase
MWPSIVRVAVERCQLQCCSVQWTTPAAVDSSRRLTLPFVRVANVVLLVTFLYALVHAAILNPFHVEPHTAWTINCYAFAIPLMIVNGFPRGVRWRPTFFDYCLLVYVVVVLATWPTSFNRHSTGIAILGLGGQLAVFGAVRLLAMSQPAMVRVIVAGLIGGIAMLEWTAFVTHLRTGLEVRVLFFPPLEWSGREGLGLAAAIQCGLLVGVWERTRSRAVQIAAIVLILGAVVECLFMYSRVPWAALAAALLAACLVGLRVGGFQRSLLAVVVIGAFVGFVGTPYMLHLARMAAGLAQGPESGLSFRLAAWFDAPKVIARNPIRGTGLGTYMAVRPTLDVPRSPYLPPEFPTPLHPHNAYLQQLAEVGIVGGAAFAMIWATAIWAGWRVSTDRALGHGINVGLFLALVALVVSNMGENMFEGTERVRFQSMAWVVSAVIIAEWSRLRLVSRPRADDV